MQDLGYGWELDDGTPVKVIENTEHFFYLNVPKSPYRKPRSGDRPRAFDFENTDWSYNRNTGIFEGDRTNGKEMFTVRPRQPTGPDKIEEMFA